MLSDKLLIENQYISVSNLLALAPCMSCANLVWPSIVLARVLSGERYMIPAKADINTSHESLSARDRLQYRI